MSSVRDYDHERYLAVALASCLASHQPAWMHFVERWTEPCHGWSGVIEEIALVARELADRVGPLEIAWGETHDQYDCLDALARLVAEAELPLTARIRGYLVTAALRTSEVHDDRQDHAE